MSCYTPEDIREIRRELGLTQEDFSRLVGVRLATVNLWEHGRHPSPLARRRLDEIRDGQRQDVPAGV